MVNDADSKYECSFSTWYPLFTKDSLEAVVLKIPDDVLEYLEHEAFLLPLEATRGISCNSEWSDGTVVSQNSTEDSADEPTFPEFSQKIQDVIDEFGAVFIKTNWSNPSDATWVAPTKTLKCTTLDEVYLLLKSSDRISNDLSACSKYGNNKNPLRPCLVLKEWREINPCTEFRCFVIGNELIGISQRDLTQYYRHIESEKYSIQRDIKSLFNERIKGRFRLSNYVFDVIRYKKDRVKIVDFGQYDESSTKGSLFTCEELNSAITDAPEFRFIAEDMGIQPQASRHFCVPREINDFFHSANQESVLQMLQREVEEDHRDRSGNSSEDSD